MGNRETGHRAFTVYYAWRGEMLRPGEQRDRGQSKRGEGRRQQGSAFVTDGTLFGIKPIGSYREHVIALNTDAVDDGTYDGFELK